MSKINDVLVMSSHLCNNANHNAKQGKEYVKNPPHYHSKCSEAEMKRIIERINKRGYIEAIDVIDAFFKNNFNLASAFRYESRLGDKDDELTEINKAIWYLEHEKEEILAKQI